MFVDPVGTGYSRAAAGTDAHQFYGFRPDIESTADFIRSYVTRHDDWSRPIYLAGESYGTTRCAALAGYLRVLTPWLVSRWAGRMLNIHPSLLPAHPGLDTHARALAAGDTAHGCTVHLVTEGVDEGPVLGQAQVPVLPGDTAESLGARVLEQEHRLYPQTLADFALRYAAEVR